jgi:hypothetical protein
MVVLSIGVNGWIAMRTKIKIVVWIILFCNLFHVMPITGTDVGNNIVNVDVIASSSLTVIVGTMILSSIITCNDDDDIVVN